MSCVDPKKLSEWKQYAPIYVYKKGKYLSVTAI